METQETVSVRGGKIVIDESELAAILKANPTASITMEDVEQKRLFAFEARVIDSMPTINKRLYTKSWQEKVLPQWMDGVRLVWGENSHTPDDRSDYGWTYSANVSTVEGVTSTIVRVAIPVIEGVTSPLVERLRLGLSKGLSLSAQISNESVKTRPDGVTEISGDGDSRLLHLAVTTNPASAAATVLSTSESIRVDETSEPVQINEHERMLIQEAKKIRQPIIESALKFKRLNSPESDPKQITIMLEKWDIDSIREYAATQESAYRARNPSATKQLAVASESDGEPRTHTHWKSLEEIMRDVTPVTK